MLEKPDDYTLPAIELAWSNVRDSKIKRARADAIVLHVADSPALRAGSSRENEEPAVWTWCAHLDWLRDHSLLSALMLLAVGVVAWFWPRAVSAIGRWIALERASDLSSEECSFARLRVAARNGDPEKVYRALLDWAARF